MLYNAYRPQKFTEVVGQKDVIENLMSQSKRDKFFGVYILCGQFGSGKTTTARILAMAANCKHKDEHGNPCGCCEDCRSIIDGTAADFQEVAAAVNTGVDKVREICDTVSYLPVALRKKVYIIDEVQALSKAAFQAFLKMLEEPPAHAMFILATTDVGAIPPTVRSRSATYYFKQLTQTEISAHCRKVSDLEGLSVTQDACDVIAKYAQGSMRNALSLLDMATQEGPATGETVERLLGVSTPDSVFSIVQSVMRGEAAEVIRKTTELSEGGADLSVLVGDMLQIVADLTVASVSLDSVKGTEHYLSLIRETVPYGSSTRFTAFADELFKAKTAMSRTPDLSVLLVTLVRVSRRSDVVAFADAPGEENAMLRSLVSSLAKKVGELEEKLANGSYVIPVAEPSVSTVIEETKEEEQEVREELVTETESVEEVQEEPVSDDLTDFSEASLEDIPEEMLFVGMDPDAVTEEASVVSCEDALVIVAEVEESSVEPVLEETVPVSEEISVKEDSEEEEEEDLFSFLGLTSAEDKKQQKSDAREAWNNLNKLSDVPMIRAGLSCCDVKESGSEVVVTSELPVAKRFISVCLSAFEQQGYDVAGIKISPK